MIVYWYHFISTDDGGIAINILF